MVGVDGADYLQRTLDGEGLAEALAGGKLDHESPRVLDEVVSASL
ncbi:hypothetical protein PSEUDO8Z_150184 [Pseudomonas sp. 8Z]|nr:hypothetical protein PSEUDO8Z_150184 [Pseudomonas sp. 8Z]